MNISPRACTPKIITPLLLAALIVAASANPASAQDQSPEVNAAIDRANALAIQKQFQQALDAFREADNLSDHTCADCYLGMVNMECQLGELLGAIDDAQRAERAAGDDRTVAAQALTVRATLLVATSSAPTDEKVKEAEREYRRALALDPKHSIARFDLGMLLLQEGRDADGVTELKAYVSGPFANPRYVDRANRVIADPSRARALPSEDFSLATIDGETISKAGLRGKVVLFDFWGSWCPPCRESVPILVDLHRKFAGHDFEIVGINSDTDEESLKSFISSNHMNWPEFFDVDGQIAGLFEIQGFPTYVVLGRGGTIEFRQTGLGPDTAANLTNAINRELAKTYTGPPPEFAPPATASTHPTAAATPVNGADASSGRAASVPIELVFPPNDVENGDASGSIYRNEFLGLSYKFPSAWSSATPEVLAQLNQARSQQMQSAGATGSGDQPGPNGSVRVSFPQIIFQAAPDPHRRLPEVTITVAQSSASAQDSARKAVEDVKRQGMAILAAPRVITIGKRQFFRTDAEAPQADPPAWIAMIEITVGQRYLVTLEIRARSNQELDDLAASAQSLSISKP
jgi:thiol-disulfide isomerase/thioredoxin